MNPLPPPLPADEKPSMTVPWVLWIAASTLLPASPFLLIGRKGMDSDACPPLIMLALVGQLGCSIWLARVIARRRNLNVGGVIAFALFLMAGSIAIGMASFFCACLGVGTQMNFH